MHDGYTALQLGCLTSSSSSATLSTGTFVYHTDGNPVNTACCGAEINICIIIFHMLKMCYSGADKGVWVHVPHHTG